MSGRDIDSTSENVLHDWQQQENSEGETDAETPLPEDAPSTPAWGMAPAPDTEVAEQDEDEASEDPEELGAEPLGAPVESPQDEVEPEPSDLAAPQLAIAPSPEHAAGDLRIPDDYTVLEGVGEGGRRAVGLVVSRFNGEVTSSLLESALAELVRAGVRREAVTIMVVPGAFELPLAATALAKTRRFACIVALGCIIRGDTPHFDFIAAEAASGLQLAALETGVPVSFGVLTLESATQAEARIEKGAEAVRSALEMADLFSQLRAAASR